jgi:hypothetical protein
MNSDQYPEPAQVDYYDEREVVTYMRHLLNLYDMLGQQGFDEEFSKFKSLLLKVGWKSSRIDELFMQASEHTRYENLVRINPTTGPWGFFDGG